MDVKIRYSMESPAAPKRKSSFRRVYEVCDRVVQLYFAEGILQMCVKILQDICPHHVLYSIYMFLKVC